MYSRSVRASGPLATPSGAARKRDGGVKKLLGTREKDPQVLEVLVGSSGHKLIALKLPAVSPRGGGLPSPTHLSRNQTLGPTASLGGAQSWLQGLQRFPRLWRATKFHPALPSSGSHRCYILSAAGRGGQVRPPSPPALLESPTRKDDPYSLSQKLRASKLNFKNFSPSPLL